MTSSFNQKSETHSHKFLKKQLVLPGEGSGGPVAQSPKPEESSPRSNPIEPKKTEEAERTFQNFFSGMKAKIQLNQQKIEEQKSKQSVTESPSSNNSKQISQQNASSPADMMSIKGISLADMRKRNKTFVSSGATTKKKKK